MPAPAEAKPAPTPAPEAKPAAAPAPVAAEAKPPAPAAADAKPAAAPPAPAAEAKPTAPTAPPTAGAPSSANSTAPPPGKPAPVKPAATQFACFAPDAAAVFVAGSFNHWDAKATPMNKDAAGNWDAAIALARGRYEYKFVVDGAMCCEPGCEGAHKGCSKCVTNASGTMNRVMEVA
jgi:hypothetical protein